MKKNIIKKLFIRLSKILGYEIIDQNEFYSPTLERKIDENLVTLSFISLSKTLVFITDGHYPF